MAAVSRFTDNTRIWMKEVHGKRRDYAFISEHFTFIYRVSQNDVLHIAVIVIVKQSMTAIVIVFSRGKDGSSELSRRKYY